MSRKYDLEPLVFQFVCPVDRADVVGELLRKRGRVAISEVTEGHSQVVVLGVCFDNQIGKVRRLLVSQGVVDQDQHDQLRVKELPKVENLRAGDLSQN